MKYGFFLYFYNSVCDYELSLKEDFMTHLKIYNSFENHREKDVKAMLLF